MHPDERLRKSVKQFWGYVGAVALAGAGPPIASSLVESSVFPARIAGVIVGVGAWVPLMWFVTSIIRASDEFTQRIHFVALSFAFASSLLLVATLDWMVSANFIEPVPYRVLWLSMAILWVIALVVAKRRVERGPERM